MVLLITFNFKKNKKANPFTASFPVQEFSTFSSVLFSNSSPNSKRVMNGSIAICSLQTLSRMVEAGARKQDLRLLLTTL